MFASIIFFFLAFIIIIIYLFILFVCLGMACLTTPVDINSFFSGNNPLFPVRVNFTKSRIDFDS